MVFDLFYCETFVYENQHTKKLTDGVCVLVAIADAGVFDTLGVKRKEILVMRDQHPFFSESKLQLNFVRRRQ